MYLCIASGPLRLKQEKEFHCLCRNNALKMMKKIYINTDVNLLVFATKDTKVTKIIHVKVEVVYPSRKRPSHFLARGRVEATKRWLDSMVIGFLECKRVEQKNG